MKSLATAVLNMAAFLELSGDEIPDPDGAASALEQLAYDLSEAEAGELEELRTAIGWQMDMIPIEARTPEEQAKADFLRNFMENLGLDNA
ncbi:MAG: hypothetical protein V4726_09405 [Verrucomicrobiota bacterium]